LIGHDHPTSPAKTGPRGDLSTSGPAALGQARNIQEMTDVQGQIDQDAAMPVEASAIHVLFERGLYGRAERSGVVNLVPRISGSTLLP